MSISGNVILVGAPETDVGTKTKQGAAYVFVIASRGWVTTSKYAAKAMASDRAKGRIAPRIGPGKSARKICLTAPNPDVTVMLHGEYVYHVSSH